MITSCPGRIGLAQMTLLDPGIGIRDQRAQGQG